MPKLSEVSGGKLKLSQVQQPRADFSDVRARVDSTEGPYSSTPSDSRYGSYIAGVGKSMRDTGVGLKQAVTEGLEQRADAVWNLFGRPGADKGDPIGKLRRYNQQQRDDEARLRASLPGMAEDPSFAAGNIIGTLGQIFTPGAALRGTNAARAFLPTTLKGNALQGALLGSVQPVAQQGERNINAGIGAAAGLVGTAIPKAVGSGYNALARLFGGQSLTGAERRAATAIREIAQNPAALSTPAPSAVPGVTRSLAQETTDPGVIALERVQRGRNPQAFAGADTDNNAARMAVLQRIAGTEGDMAAAETARESLSGALRDRAFSEADAAARQSSRAQALALGTPLPQSGLKQQAEAIAAQNATRPSVQSALNDVTRALEKSDGSAASLYKVRQYIGDLLSGKAGSDKGYAQAASRELMEIRSLVDQELERLAPTFPKYLDAYRQGSIPINRMQVGRELIDRSTAANPADIVGTPLLQAARYGNAFGDLDAIAASATGFKKARADQILGASDFAALKAIDDDMTRIAIANRSPQVGSQTDANKYIGDQMADEVIQGVLKDVPFARIFANRASEQTQQKLAYLLANPEEYRRVAAALPTKQRELLNKALLQLSARPAAAAPALAE